MTVYDVVVRRSEAWATTARCQWTPAPARAYAEKHNELYFLTSAAGKIYSWEQPATMAMCRILFEIENWAT